MSDVVTTILIVAPGLGLLFVWLERFSKDRDEPVPGQEVETPSHVRVVPASIGEQVRAAHRAHVALYDREQEGDAA